MATKFWLGDALDVAQVNTITPATVETDDIFTITMGGQSISFTATAGTVANVTAGLVALLNASTIPEFAEVTWADITTALTGTADTAGKPFVQTSSETDGGGNDTQTLVTATTTASSGKNDWSTAPNWSDGAVPVNSDVVILENSTVSILYGLAQSAVTLTKMEVKQSYTGTLGLPNTNIDSTPYGEYRETYLEISVTTLEIGRGEGLGSGRIKINVGSNLSTVSVFGSGPRAEDAINSILFLGANASNVLNITKGDMGVALFASEVSTFLTIKSSFTESVLGDVKLTLSTGVTLTDLDVTGGRLEIDSDTTTIDQNGGDIEIFSGVHASLDIDNGNLFYRSTGTITAAKVGSDGLLDFSRDLRGRTVTNLELNENSSFVDPNRTATFSNPIQLPRTGIEKLKRLEVGTNITLTIASL